MRFADRYTPLGPWLHLPSIRNAVSIFEPRLQAFSEADSWYFHAQYLCLQACYANPLLRSFADFPQPFIRPRLSHPTADTAAHVLRRLRRRNTHLPTASARNILRF